MAEATLRIRKNDIVKIVAGKDKGKVGRVLKVDPESLRITVEKVNLVKRHLKPGKASPQGGIVEKESPIAYSNVRVMCDKCNKPARIRMSFDGSGEKYRACAKCGDPIETRRK